MLKAVKILIAISYASLISFASTFASPIWHVGFDIRPVRLITFAGFVIAAITARLLLAFAMHRDNLARGIIPPFPYYGTELGKKAYLFHVQETRTSSSPR
jgi:hypothetical protein